MAEELKDALEERARVKIGAKHPFMTWWSTRRWDSLFASAPDLFPGLFIRRGEATIFKGWRVFSLHLRSFCSTIVALLFSLRVVSVHRMVHDSRNRSSLSASLSLIALEFRSEFCNVFEKHFLVHIAVAITCVRCVYKTFPDMV